MEISGYRDCRSLFNGIPDIVFFGMCYGAFFWKRYFCLIYREIDFGRSVMDEGVCNAIKT